MMVEENRKTKKAKHRKIQVSRQEMLNAQTTTGHQNRNQKQIYQNLCHGLGRVFNYGAFTLGQYVPAKYPLFFFSLFYPAI